MNEFGEKDDEKKSVDDLVDEILREKSAKADMSDRSDMSDDSDNEEDRTTETVDIDPTAISKEYRDSEEEEKEKPFENAVDWVCSIVFTAAAVILINLFLFRAITVDGTSMCDTLQDKDVVITTNLVFEPKFGDVVVIESDKLIHSETGLYGEPIIKRVIGEEGDTIRFDLETGDVYRNGEKLSEDYILGPTNQSHRGWVESGVDYVVPENCVFVLGDNRIVSHDSRDLNLIGFVDKKYIMGKALFRLFPLDKMRLL